MLLAACLGWVLLNAPGDLVLFDFEGDDYAGWAVRGTACGSGPARGTLPGQMVVSGFRGRGLVNSFRGGDASTGELLSPALKLERRYLAFLIGGGQDPARLALELLVDGQVVRTATGPNDRPGGSERLHWEHWELADLQGREARVRIRDAATGGWGHLNVDHLMLCEELPVSTRRRPVDTARRYLNLPYAPGAPLQRVVLRQGETVVREFEMELATGEPLCYMFVDLAPLRGAATELVIADYPADCTAWEQIVEADQIVGGEQLYREPLRPQFHFSSRRGWNNDPNGLVYLQGEWHLFYQHNPYGTGWGNMHWGHAVSGDLVHWRELPIALYPQRFGDWVFSGSAAVDTPHTTGLGTPGQPALLAAYTSTGRGECLVVSVDRGRTWRELPDQPAVRHQGRDPRLLWHAPTQRWVMAVYDEVKPESGDALRQCIAFYTSADLRAWELGSRIDGYYECPELFELPVDGEPGERRWVVYGANGSYQVGAFDGRTFTPEAPQQRFHHGNCYYASQTFSDVPAADGRRVQIAWGQVTFPGAPWGQQMTFPVSLTLRRTAAGLRLQAAPVAEIASLRSRRHNLTNLPLAPGDANPLAAAQGELFDLTLDIAVGTARQVGLAVRGVPLLYDVPSGELQLAGLKAPLALRDGRLQLRLLADRGSLELFASDGSLYLPAAAVAAEHVTGLSLFARGGAARVVDVTVWELKSAWE
ncbi:MAG: glycoside hydrolase family 32 protein [Fimbriimonadaceae bacterium]|nr:glycoside hydrolase family 32 protein [Fimbriimonadaceae bacterium]